MINIIKLMAAEIEKSFYKSLRQDKNQFMIEELEIIDDKISDNKI